MHITSAWRSSAIVFSLITFKPGLPTPTGRGSRATASASAATPAGHWCYTSKAARCRPKTWLYPLPALRPASPDLGQRRLTLQAARRWPAPATSTTRRNSGLVSFPDHRAVQACRNTRIGQVAYSPGGPVLRFGLDAAGRYHHNEL